MAWIPFKSSGTAPDTQSTQPSLQVEQRTDRHLNLDGQTKTSNDISTTLNQLSSPGSRPEVQNLEGIPVNKIDTSVTEFVQKRPANLFIIDGEKYSDESIICTSTESGKTCLKLGCNSIQLFKHMQKLEYFCSLPNDIDATYFECRKIK